MVKVPTVNMKIQAKLLLVVLFVGVAVGTEENVAKSGPPERFCPPILGDHVPLPIYVKVHEVVKSCNDALDLNTMALRRENATDEEIQETCDDICRHQSQFGACLEAVASDVALCPNPTMLNLYNIDRDLVMKFFEHGCADGAKRAATVARWVRDTPKTSPIVQHTETCGLKFGAVLSPLDKSDVDISSKVFIFSKEMLKFVECFNLGNDHQPSREVLEYFFNEVLVNMKCIHPQDGTLVPCASISVDQVSAPSICEVKTHNSKLVMHDTLENDAGRCFDYLMSIDSLEEDITSKNEALREDMKEYCSSKKDRLKCLDEKIVLSDICLDETQNGEFRLSIDSVKKGLDAACLEDGKRLADILFEVYRLKKAGQGHAVWDCLDVAKATRNELDEHTSSSKNMRFYHEVDAFKGCLVNKLGGDVTSVAAATSLIDETLKMIECVNVHDGTTVTCESLMHHHH